jgi:hypothetical protein
VDSVRKGEKNQKRISSRSSPDGITYDVSAFRQVIKKTGDYITTSRYEMARLLRHFANYFGLVTQYDIFPVFRNSFKAQSN